MKREIKFRGIKKSDNKFITGDLNHFGTLLYVFNKYIDGDNLNSADDYEIIPKSLGQYTGLKDKNGKEIYEGDIIRTRRPYRTTQTHVGDNIPNGRYTEPMEPSIKTTEGFVVFKDGFFAIDSEDLDMHEADFPMSMCYCEYDIDMIIDEISYGKPDLWVFDDVEEGDLQVLIEESGVQDIDELIKYLSGIEIIGNIHENPELINKNRP